MSTVPQLTTPMVALAWCVLHCPGDTESGKVLARLILDAAQDADVDS